MTDSTDIRRGRHAVWDCHAHLVFITKYRRGVFTDQMLNHCQKTMTKVCQDFNVTLDEFNGEEDHVHLLVNFPANISLSKLVNSLKGVSSRLLRRDHGDQLDNKLWGGHLWSRSYYAGTTGGANIDTVRAYIEQQDRPQD